MGNNEILRRVQTLFDYDNEKVASLFTLTGGTVTDEQISLWLDEKQATDTTDIDDTQFSHFLNGLIIENRGAKDGPQPTPSKTLTNNSIFKKLRIAFDLSTEDILEIFETTETPLDRNRLSSYFRRENHKHYRSCEDETLHLFLKGMWIKSSSK